jgi:adenylate cyclase
VTDEGLGPDPELARRPVSPELVEVVRALGASVEDIEKAEHDGSFVLLAIDRMALGQDLRFDAREAAGAAGLPEEDLRHIWRSLGFPDPPPGERMFSDVDVANLAAVADLLRSGVVEPEVAYGMTRVIGSSMARVASALIDAVSARAQSAMDADAAESDALLEPLAADGSAFLASFPDVLEQVWRRHLQAAARRRLLRSDADESAGMVVGFADLVGFTALAQQVSDQELAEVVDQFERLAYDVVVAGGGRVLKMIGDEVMFLVEDPIAAAEIALGLADASRDAAELSDVRVGLARGPVLEREGDAYGPTVNLASRITAIAYPGAVVVSPDLRAVLEEDGAFAFRGMRPRYLKNIGRVSLSVLRRAEDAPSTLREAIDERRHVMREAMRERLAARGVAPTEGD